MTAEPAPLRFLRQWGRHLAEAEELSGRIDPMAAEGEEPQMRRTGRWATRVGLVALVLVMAVPAVSQTDDATIPPRMVMPQADPELPGGEFIDTDGHVFAVEIDWLAAVNVTQGCNPPENTRFCPDDPVTRGQMAAFLRRALPDLATSRSPASFDDIDQSVFAGDITWLSQTGVTLGCNPPENTRFCPRDPVTRGQMAAFLVRALSLTARDPGVVFDDDDGSVFEGDIERLATAGITRGCDPPANTRFCPGDPVTRGQMAAFLHRALADTLGAGGGDTPPLEGGDPGTGTDPGLDKPTEGGDPSGELSEVGELPDFPISGEPAVDDFDYADVPPPGLPGPADEVVWLDDEMPPAPMNGEGLAPQINVSQSVLTSSSDWLDYNSLPYSVGQVLLWLGTDANGRNIWGTCSGTLVDRNVVLTAAHCITPMSGLPVLGFYFVPDRYGDATRTYWWGTRRVYHSEFLTNGAWALDYALLVVGTDSQGRYPGDVYSTMPVYMLGSADPGLGFGPYSWNVSRLSLGYPTEGWWSQWNSEGKAWPWYCSSSSGMFVHWGGGFYSLSTGCTLSGGHSGGPILQTIDGKRYVVSVNSTGGLVYTCIQYGLSCGNTRWAMFNIWGPPLLNTPGDYGYDDVWRAVYNSSVNGGI